VGLHGVGGRREAGYFHGGMQKLVFFFERETGRKTQIVAAVVVVVVVVVIWTSLVYTRTYLKKRGYYQFMRSIFT